MTFRLRASIAVAASVLPQAPIFHDSTQAPTTPAADWTPKGLCRD